MHRFRIQCHRMPQNVFPYNSPYWLHKVGCVNTTYAIFCTGPETGLYTSIGICSPSDATSFRMELPSSVQFKVKRFAKELSPKITHKHTHTQAQQLRMQRINTPYTHVVFNLQICIATHPMRPFRI